MTEFLKELKFTIDNTHPRNVPSWIHRYYRKLALTSMQESNNEQEQVCKFYSIFYVLF